MRTPPDGFQAHPPDAGHEAAGTIVQVPSTRGSVSKPGFTIVKLVALETPTMPNINNPVAKPAKL